MTTFSEALQTVMRRAGVGSRTLSKLTGIPRTSIDNWWEGTARRPQHWRPLLQIARVLLLSQADVDALLSAAGYPPLASLARELPIGHPDRRHLQSWLETPSAGKTALRHQLRAPITDFVGRASEITRLVSTLQVAAENGAVAAISGVRGMGGIGKTELALLVAQRLADAFPDAQIVLTLRGTGAVPLPAEQALQQVIHTFTPDGQLPTDLEALQQRYCAVLHGKRALILADDACDAAQVRPLLPPAGCALLVTSRQRFMLPGMVTVDLEQLAEREAVALLRGICLRLGAAEAQAIAQACGYLPLALRVSGSILHNDPALPVAAYIQHLSDERQRLAELRDPEDGQLDVEASLALSYAQLDGTARQIFRQLGVLIADFGTELAQAVVELDADVDVEATLHRLLRRNLVMYGAERSRWQLHDLVRDLARGELEAAGELEAVAWRYARAAVQITQATQDQYLAGGDGVLAAVARFDAERAHIDAGRYWAVARAATPEGDQLLVDMAAATRYIGYLRYDARHERLPQWEGTLAAARRLGDRHAEGQALNQLGIAYMDLGEARRAIPCLEQYLTIARALGDQRGEGQALGNLGIAYTNLGEAQRAIPYLEQYLIIARSIGDQRIDGLILGNLGNAYTELGEGRRAIPYYEQAIAIARTIGDRRLEGWALGNLGLAYTVLGDARRALDSCEEACTIARQIGDQLMEAYALSYLAHAQAREGNLAHATTTFEQAVALLSAVGDRWGEAECQRLFGLALAQQGERERAVPLLRAAVAYEAEIGHAKAAEHAALLARLEASAVTSFEF